MADAVIGGLLLSTALSLVVVPAFYVVADGLKSRGPASAHAPPRTPVLMRGSA